MLKTKRSKKPLFGKLKMGNEIDNQYVKSQTIEKLENQSKKEKLKMVGDMSAEN